MAIESFDKKIFLDTAPIIYYLQFNPEWTQRTVNYFDFYFVNGYEFVTSVITYSEFLTQPFRKKDYAAVNKFKNFLTYLSCKIVRINLPVAHLSAKLRAKYGFLRTPDALQLASAIVSGCSRFLTNDRRLKQVSEITVVTLEDKN